MSCPAHSELEELIAEPDRAEQSQVGHAGRNDAGRQLSTTTTGGWRVQDWQLNNGMNVVRVC